MVTQKRKKDFKICGGKNLGSPCTVSWQLEDAVPILFSALHVYSPMSALEVLLIFRQATPFENSILHMAEDLSFPSALNQDTLISGVPPIWHFKQTASPAVTSIGSNCSIKYGGSRVKK